MSDLSISNISSANVMKSMLSNTKFTQPTEEEKDSILKELEEADSSVTFTDEDDFEEETGVSTGNNPLKTLAQTLAGIFSSTDKTSETKTSGEIKDFDVSKSPVSSPTLFQNLEVYAEKTKESRERSESSKNASQEYADAAASDETDFAAKKEAKANAKAELEKASSEAETAGTILGNMESINSSAMNKAMKNLFSGGVEDAKNSVSAAEDAVAKINENIAAIDTSIKKYITGLGNDVAQIANDLANGATDAMKECENSKSATDLETVSDAISSLNEIIEDFKTKSATSKEKVDLLKSLMEQEGEDGEYYKLLNAMYSTAQTADATSDNVLETMTTFAKNVQSHYDYCSNYIKQFEDLKTSFVETIGSSVSSEDSSVIEYGKNLQDKSDELQKLYDEYSSKSWITKEEKEKLTETANEILNAVKEMQIDAESKKETIVEFAKEHFAEAYEKYYGGKALEKTVEDITEFMTTQLEKTKGILDGVLELAQKIEDLQEFTPATCLKDFCPFIDRPNMSYTNIVNSGYNFVIMNTDGVYLAFAEKSDDYSDAIRVAMVLAQQDGADVSSMTDDDKLAAAKKYIEDGVIQLLTDEDPDYESVQLGLAQGNYTAYIQDSATLKLTEVTDPSSLTVKDSDDTKEPDDSDDSKTEEKSSLYLKNAAGEEVPLSYEGLMSQTTTGKLLVVNADGAAVAPTITENEAGDKDITAVWAIVTELANVEGGEEATRVNTSTSLEDCEAIIQEYIEAGKLVLADNLDDNDAFAAGLQNGEYRLYELVSDDESVMKYEERSLEDLSDLIVSKTETAGDVNGADESSTTDGDTTDESGETGSTDEPSTSDTDESGTTDGDTTDESGETGSTDEPSTSDTDENGTTDGDTTDESGETGSTDEPSTSDTDENGTSDGNTVSSDGEVGKTDSSSDVDSEDAGMSEEEAASLENRINAYVAAGGTFPIPETATEFSQAEIEELNDLFNSGYLS